MIHFYLLEFLINGTILHFFGGGRVVLVSFIQHFLRFIHVIVSVSISLLFVVKLYSLVWMYHGLFICSSPDGYLGGFQFLAVTNKAALNSDVISFLPYNCLSHHFTDEKNRDSERSSSLSKVTQHRTLNSGNA